MLLMRLCLRYIENNMLVTWMRKNLQQGVRLATSSLFLRHENPEEMNDIVCSSLLYLFMSHFKWKHLSSLIAVVLNLFDFLQPGK